MMVKAITVMAGLAVVVQCVCAINHMTIKTRNGVRLAYLGMLIAAAAAALAAMYEVDLSGVNAALLLAVVGYVFANRRRTYMVKS